MKFITLVNNQYSDIAHNFYIQLQKINRHRDFVIYCNNNATLNTMLSKNLDCTIELYSPKLYNQNFELIHTSFTDNISKPDTKNYSILNVIKHDVVYDYLTKNPQEKYVLLVDTDIIIFDDFVDDLISIMDWKLSVNIDIEPLIVAVKYYLHFNRDLLHKIYFGKKNMINTGFMLFHNTERTLKLIRKYYSFMSNFVLDEFSMNIDELLVTNILELEHIGVSNIPDSIHMVSDVSRIYKPSDIEQLKNKTKSFHLTFTIDQKISKIDFLKQSNYWFL